MNRFQKMKKSYFQIAGAFLLLLLAALLLWINNSRSMQAMPSMIGSVRFEGEYRIGDGEWHEIVEGEHIPATQGDVTLRGNFHMWDPEGVYEGIYRYEIPIAFFVDHINLTFCEAGSEPVVLDTENDLYGDSVCGVRWEAYALTSAGEETIEILIHNPHRFGNETAIDEMLSKTALWTGIDFENSVSDSGASQRSAGTILILIAIVFLGIALFSSLIHVKSSKLIWLIGLMVLFAGLYFSYRAEGIHFHSESTVSNTTILGALVAAIEASPDIREVASFSDCEEALAFVKSHPTDVAFLDINMRGMGGLALAEKIIAARPHCKIVFCTGYEEYAIPAFKLHASGYLMKPISAEDVQAEIDNIKGVRQKEKLLTVNCFGNFEVYVKDEKLMFKRSKTKELFAFLVDRRGAGMTAKQICVALFPDDTDDTKNAAYLRQHFMDLKNTLKLVGAEAVLCHETPYYRVDIGLIKCDYISYLEGGKPEFRGEYMMQYSWAEETCAMLLFKK